MLFTKDLLRAALTFAQMQYVQLRVTHRFIALITSGLEDRSRCLPAIILQGLHWWDQCWSCALNMIYILFADCLIYRITQITFDRFMLYYIREKMWRDSNSVTKAHFVWHLWCKWGVNSEGLVHAVWVHYWRQVQLVCVSLSSRSLSSGEFNIFCLQGRRTGMCL